ncbi:MAG: prephenate dehydrogenase [bacterium]|nr:prephenate dehydrogenase [bacterium]
MAEFQRAVIVGVGLLGGSLGLALRRRGLAKEIIGVGRQSANLSQAVDCGAIDQAATNLGAACEQADLVVVCTPVQTVAGFVEQASPYVSSEALITDVGSTKGSIVSQLANNLRFCGAHPLAGSDKSGVQHADAELFQDRTTILTPHPNTPVPVTERCEQLWRALGCHTQRMDAQQHDQALAMTSHLPHLVAAALAGGTPRELLPLAASGWCDTTRVAGGSVDMWLQIFQDNRPAVLAALRQFEKQISEWVEALGSQDDEQLRILLDTGKQIRDSVGS